MNRIPSTAQSRAVDGVTPPNALALRPHGFQYADQTVDGPDIAGAIAADIGISLPDMDQTARFLWTTSQFFIYPAFRH